MLLRLSILIGITLISACSTVTLAPAPVSQAEPSWREHRPFYGFGWLGDNQVAVDELCAGRDLQQLQAYRSGSDALLALLTLGLYAPLTLDVWCAPSRTEMQP